MLKCRRERLFVADNQLGARDQDAVREYARDMLAATEREHDMVQADVEREVGLDGDDLLGAELPTARTLVVEGEVVIRCVVEHETIDWQDVEGQSGRPLVPQVRCDQTD